MYKIWFEFFQYVRVDQIAMNLTLVRLLSIENTMQYRFCWDF